MTHRTEPHVRVRPWRTGDAALVREAGDRLSPRSLWGRFGVGTTSLPRAYLRMLEQHPADDHGIAMVVALHDDKVIGWAESRPVPGGDEELAVVVVDDWQCRGVGSRLVRALLQDPARTRQVITAYVLGENTAAHRLLRSVAPAGVERNRSDQYVHYRLAA